LFARDAEEARSRFLYLNGSASRGAGGSGASLRPLGAHALILWPLLPAKLRIKTARLP